jgi:hypothetical protein
MAPGFKDDSTVKSRLLLSRILTTAKPDSRAIVFLADSITDGNCSTVDTNNRWPDHIAERLQRENYPDIAVVNEAYPGDRVLTNGMGKRAQPVRHIGAEQPVGVHRREDDGHQRHWLARCGRDHAERPGADRRGCGGRL